MARWGEARSAGVDFVTIASALKTRQVTALNPAVENVLDPRDDRGESVKHRLSTKILPKLSVGTDFLVGVEFSVTDSADVAKNLMADLRQIPDDLGFADKVRLIDEVQ